MRSVTITAISNTSITLQFNDLKMSGDLFGAMGTLIFNGTAQANLPAN